MISPSLTSEAEPRSHTFRVALFSLACTFALADIALFRMQSSTHQDVIWLDVGVDDTAFAHERESEKHLMRIGPHSSHVKSDIFTESLDDISQVHTEAVSFAIPSCQTQFAYLSDSVTIHR